MAKKGGISPKRRKRIVAVTKRYREILEEVGSSGTVSDKMETILVGTEMLNKFLKNFAICPTMNNRIDALLNQHISTISSDRQVNQVFPKVRTVICDFEKQVESWAGLA